MLLLYSATARRVIRHPAESGVEPIFKNQTRILRGKHFESAEEVLRRENKIYLVDAESKVQFQYNYVVEVCHEGMQQSFRKNTQIGVTRLLGGSIHLETKKKLPRHLTAVDPRSRFHTSQSFGHNC